VKIMRDEVGRKIDYWEITNERDGLYEKIGKLPELWKIYNTVALAIKKEDPAALTGGPAFTWSKPLWVNGFVDNCIQNADFVTYHNYGIGDVHDSNEKLYATLDSVEGHARSIRAAVDKASPGRRVPIFLDEYNVKWVWNPIEPRHANSVGAVWQAGAVRRALLAGIDGATVWHVKGNAYGIIDGENKPRPTAAMFEWGPKWMVGNMIKATVDDKNSIELLPIETPGGGRSLLVICKANHSVRLPPAGQLLGDTPTNVMRVDADGVIASLVVDSAAPLIVPGYSLTLLTNSTK